MSTVGSEAIDRASSFYIATTAGPNYCAVDANNPITATSTITSIEAWFALADTPNVVTLFTCSKSGDVFTLRDGQTLALNEAVAGSKQTYTVSLAAQAGDYLGVTAEGMLTDVAIEKDVAGGSGIYTGDSVYHNGFATLSLTADAAISLLGYWVIDDGVSETFALSDTVSIAGLGAVSETFALSDSVAMDIVGQRLSATASIERTYQATAKTHRIYEANASIERTYTATAEVRKD